MRSAWCAWRVLHRSRVLARKNHHENGRNCLIDKRLQLSFSKYIHRRFVLRRLVHQMGPATLGLAKQ
jgi:hypothetical protein